MPNLNNIKLTNIAKTTIFAVLPLLFSAHSFAAPATATATLKWEAKVEPRNCTSVEVSNTDAISDMKAACSVDLQLTSTQNDDVMSFNI